MRFLVGILVVVGCRMLVAFVAIVAIAWLVLGQAFAAHVFELNAYDIQLPSDYVAFRNVAESGDLIVVGRYNLPAGFDELEAEMDWQHHGTAGVLARLIWVEPPSLQDRTPPDLGWNVLVFYLSAGHGASWGSASLFVRMQGNPAYFANVNVQTRAINYSATDADSATLVVDSPSRQISLCDVFEDQLEAIEQADPDIDPGDLVSGGLITDDGTQMVMAAFSGAASLLPGCLVASLVGSGTEFAPSDPALRDARVAQVEATAFWTRWEALMDEHGYDPILYGVLASVAVAGFALVFMTTFSGGSIVYGMASGLVSFLGMGLWFPHHVIQVVFVIIAVLGLLSLTFFGNRLPR